MEREVRLYGPLAKFIGQRSFMAEVSNAAEALRMLIYQFPGLEQHMADQHYKVIVDGYESDLEELHSPASQTIRFVPVIGGAGGGGVGKILAGIALVAIAIILPGAGMFVGGAVGFGTTAGFAGITAVAGNIGLALIFGGVSQLLSPTPQIGSFGPASAGAGSGRRQTTTEGSELDPQASYSFSGIQNTSNVGTPVPLVYGETVVGSIVLSAGLDTDTI